MADNSTQATPSLRSLSQVQPTFTSLCNCLCHEMKNHCPPPSHCCQLVIIKISVHGLNNIQIVTDDEVTIGNYFPEV